MTIDTSDDVVQDQQDEQVEGDEQAAEGETPEGEQQSTDASAEPEAEAEDDGEVVITIGDEEPPAAAADDQIEGKAAPAWVKELRKETRELKRRNRELEQAVAAREAPAAVAAPTVGAKPTLEDCDYDAEVYGEKLLEWTDAKRKADAAADAARAEQEAAQAEWEKRLTSYQAAKKSLKVEDFDGAEDVVRQAMSQTQIGVMLNGAEKPELLVYAIGRNPAKAKELAAIKDPVKFAFAVSKLEAQLKVTPRKTPPAPERQVRGTAVGATSVDNTLARLEAEADRTGDRSKIAAYRREQRSKAAA